MYKRLIATRPILNEIFDGALNVFAYELLFRGSRVNRFEPDAIAAQSVIVDSTMVFDMERLIGSAKAFVNVDEKSLLNEAPRLLDPRRVVLELLESVNPSMEVHEACRELRRAGYELALDDFVVGDDKWTALLPLVNFLKVDYRGCDEAAQRSIADRYLRQKISLIAEKVETEAEYERAESGLVTDTFKGSFSASQRCIRSMTFPRKK